MEHGRTPPIFDGHNDVLLRLYRMAGDGPEARFVTGDGGHIDAPRAEAGGFAGGFFAVFVPSPSDIDAFAEMAKPAYDIPLPMPVPFEEALPVALSQAAILFRLQEEGAVHICRSVRDIETCLHAGQMAAVLHMEGAEAISHDLRTLDVFYQAGLRSLGPVWSRSNAFGEGVPFRFPGDPDVGDGLTALGRALVARCETLSILIDLSHLNAAGFWDVARLSKRPLVATHSNAHAITPHARNLTDRQLHAIRDSDGLVGLNFATAFLSEDGAMRANCGLDALLRHIDHLIQVLGEDRVGFGSDFDGAVVPETIDDVAGLPALRARLAQHGIGPALMEKLCHRNWMRVLRLVWGG